MILLFWMVVLFKYWNLCLECHCFDYFLNKIFLVFFDFQNYSPLEKVNDAKPKQQKNYSYKKNLIKRWLYPFPFLFLLDFFLGRTISIHFWNFAPNIATLICLWRPARACWTRNYNDVLDVSLRWFVVLYGLAGIN